MLAPGQPPGQVPWSRDLIPSLVNTLFRCYSTVRGLRNSRGADLRVGQPVACQTGDLLLLGGELVARLDRALAHLPTRRQQLVAGALGERSMPIAASISQA